jgi:hypothetical protein
LGAAGEAGVFINTPHLPSAIGRDKSRRAAIGLSNADADKDRNIQLLKERSWFDIPVVYNNSRRAILAMEKGTPGERAFADAFKAWKQ